MADVEVARRFGWEARGDGAFFCAGQGDVEGSGVAAAEAGGRAGGGAFPRRAEGEAVGFGEGGAGGRGRGDAGMPPRRVRGGFTQFRPLADGLEGAPDGAVGGGEGAADEEGAKRAGGVERRDRGFEARAGFDGGPRPVQPRVDLDGL